MALKPIKVSQLNNYIKRILATDPILMNVVVIGEITNLTKHSSGHWYFSLKDETSTVRCFLSLERVKQLRFDLEEGMKLTVCGSVSVYERGGSYSLNIKTIDIEGEGDLKKAFDLLKNKLQAEGLFDEERKKEIPVFPKKIGVVTSSTGAAIKDIITTVKRRNPFTSVVLYPCLVQGPDAAQSIVKGIKAFNTKFKDIDVLIVGRGGGSTEDLWAFNEESVVRAIAASDIPVISAVGHEIDYVISDFAADLRAATPTAAAELAVIDIEYYKDIIRNCSPKRLFNALKDNINDGFKHTENLLLICNSAILSKFEIASQKLQMLKLTIDSNNPYLQLEKGYSIVKDSNGKWINSEKDIKPNDRINILLKDGDIECLVLNKQ